MPSFVRRKFTITEQLDSVLTDLADQHYQGNVSLCIRAAIEDHRSTLQGRDGESLAAQRLAARLKEIDSQQQEIAATIDELSVERESQPNNNPEHNTEGAPGLTGSMQLVYDELLEAECPLRLKGISERADVPVSVVHQAVGSLVDLGLVVDVGTSSERFVLAGCSFGHAKQP